MRALKSLPTIANVAAGNDISIMLPVGNVYEKVHVDYTGATAAQLENIKLELNTRMVSEWANGARLISIDNHYKRTQTSGTLTFNFTRPELHQLADQRFFGLDTSRSQGIQTAAINFKINAAATNPTLKAYAETTQAVQGVPNYLTKVRQFIMPVSAAGTFDIDNIPRPNGASIAAIHLYMADGADGDSDCDITQAELLVDNVNWHENMPAARAAKIQTQYGRNPQTTESAVIDLILDGDIKHALPLTRNIQDFRIRATASGAGQVVAVVEYIDLWGAGRF